MAKAENIDPSEVQAEVTEGFKLGQKRTIKEYTSLDAEDESLNRWKKSLGLGTGEDLSDPNDPRTVIIQSLSFIPDNHDPIHFDLTTPEGLKNLRSKPFVIKEGAVFRLAVSFKVQHQILSGLKYVQVVRRTPFSNKLQQMIGSYGPCTTDRPVHKMTFEPETAPSGFVSRGVYKAVSKFVDDDGHTHLTFDWSFEIKKDW